MIWPHQRGSLLLVVSLGIAVAGCGGGDDDGAKPSLPRGAAARVGDTVIRESAVQARMLAVYRSVGGDIASFGPPRYTTCAEIKRFQLSVTTERGKPTKSKRPRVDEQTVLKECRVDFANARAQAVAFLVRTQWLAREAKRQNVHAEARTAHIAGDALAPPPGKPEPAADQVALQARATAEEEGLLAVLPISKQQLAAHAGEYASRLRRLNAALREHYASETTCAKKYRVQIAPECS